MSRDAYPLPGLPDGYRLERPGWVFGPAGIRIKIQPDGAIHSTVQGQKIRFNLVTLLLERVLELEAASADNAQNATELARLRDENCQLSAAQGRADALRAELAKRPAVGESSSLTDDDSNGAPENVADLLLSLSVSPPGGLTATAFKGASVPLKELELLRRENEDLRQRLRLAGVED